jgi:hypothetical protein
MLELSQKREGERPARHNRLRQERTIFDLQVMRFDRRVWPVAR